MNLITQYGLRGLVLVVRVNFILQNLVPPDVPLCVPRGWAVSKGNSSRKVELVNDSYVCHSPQVSVTKYMTSD